MAYIELDIDEALFTDLQILADEDGISIEDLIVDILRDETAFSDDEDDTEEVEEEEVDSSDAN